MNISDRAIEIAVWVILAITLAAVAAGSIVAYRRGKAFKEWAAVHCKVIAHVSGDVLPTTGVAITPNGSVSPTVGITMTPDKKGYQCDDGITYWR